MSEEKDPMLSSDEDIEEQSPNTQNSTQGWMHNFYSKKQELLVYLGIPALYLSLTSILFGVGCALDNAGVIIIASLCLFGPVLGFVISAIKGGLFKNPGMEHAKIGVSWFVSILGSSLFGAGLVNHREFMLVIGTIGGFLPMTICLALLCGLYYRAML